MFKNMKAWHYILIAVGIYLLYRWWQKKNSVPAVVLPANDVSETTLDPTPEDPEENTDPTVQREVTKVYGPDNY